MRDSTKKGRSKADCQRKSGCKRRVKQALFALYSLTVVIFLSASFSFNALGLFGAIDLEKTPYWEIDLSITAFLWVEYLTRLCLCPRKGEYFKENIVELFSILPYSPVLGLLHLVRLLHFLRLFETAFFFKLRKKFRAARPTRLLKRTGRRVGFLMNAQGFLYGLYAFAILFLTLCYLNRIVEETGYGQAVSEIFLGAATLCLFSAPKNLFGQIASGALLSLFCALLVWFAFACRAHVRRLKRLKNPVRRMVSGKTSDIPRNL